VAPRFSSIRFAIGILCILFLYAGCSVRRVAFNDVVTVGECGIGHTLTLVDMTRGPRAAS
jgi:hypothetical protein